MGCHAGLDPASMASKGHWIAGQARNGKPFLPGQYDPGPFVSYRQNVATSSPLK